VNWGHWHRGDEMYEGTWKHGLKHGLGRYIDADGNKFFGRWDKDSIFFFGNTGSKHGLGRYIDADGNKFFGRWDKDFCYFYQPEEAIPNNVNVFIPKITEFR
jgi:hypothetical protein